MRAVLVLVAGLMLAPTAARGQQPLVIELGAPQVEIDIGFRGSELLIFGLVEPNTDAIVVIRGETRAETVRRKERILGVWTTGQARTFQSVPSFYAIGASRPLDHMFADESTLYHYELGPTHINFTPLDMTPGDPVTDRFRDALIGYKFNRGLYADATYPVKFVSDQLFRTTFYIPANVPVGRYVVRLHMVRDGRIVGQRDTHLIVDKVGVEEQIHEFAYTHGSLYGLFAVIMALLSGWLVTLFFRRSP